MFREAYTKQLAKKWQRVLDYDKYPEIKSQIVRENVALMLENTAHYLKEAVFTGGAGTGGGHLGDDFPKLAIPLLRRVMPGLIANELVGVQPMTSPVGLAFALRFSYTCAASAQTPASAEAVLNVSKDAVTFGARSPSGIGADGTGQGHGTNEDWADGVQDMALGIAQQQISAATRKLRTAFSLEMAQDVKALHNIDIDDELTNLLTYEIQAEIEQELIYDLIQLGSSGAAADLNPTGVVPSYVSATSANYDNNEIYAFRGLWTRIQDAANTVATQTRRGPANWILCSPKTLTALQSITNFIITPVPNDIDFANVAAKKVGYINNGKTAVYLDLFQMMSWFPDVVSEGSTQEYCLVGYKGASELDAGLFYAPYVPILVVKAQEPNAFQPRIGVMSRYAIANSLLGAERYYKLLRFDYSGTALG